MGTPDEAPRPSDEISKIITAALQQDSAQEFDCS